ncbi:unnamed protein product [Ectocarpus sp. 12 AP-2014]
MRFCAQMKSCCFASLLLAYGAAQDSHDSHSDHSDHDSHSDHTSHSDEESHAEHDHAETAVVYDMEPGSYSLAAFRASGGSEVEDVGFMIVAAASADLEGLEGAEEDADAAWDAYIDSGEATVLTNGTSATPSAGVVYLTTLTDPLMMVPVDVVDAGAYALLFEHSSDEVGTALVSESGDVLVGTSEEVDEEEEEEEEEEDDSEPATASQWGNAILATVLVSLCSFTGVLTIINQKVAHAIGLSHTFTFASGALLTASLLHIIPESLEGIAAEYDHLHDAGLWAGLAILGGIGFSILIHALMESGHGHGHGHGHTETNQAATAAVGDGPAPAGTAPLALTIKVTPENLWALISERKERSLLDLKGLKPVCWNVVAGELVHNFADGVTIGAAFLTCGSSMGWTITASTVLHEIPQELADFMALLAGGMSLKQAFLFNFLSALTCVLGAVVILSLRSELSDADVSVILLLGSGSFIFIALTELLPGALEVTKAESDRAGGAVTCNQVKKLGSFLLGAALIGGALIFDQHCEGEGHDH